ADQVDHRGVAAVEPGAGEAEGGTRPLLEADHLDEEPPGRLQVRRADIDVLQRADRHRLPPLHRYATAPTFRRSAISSCEKPQAASPSSVCCPALAGGRWTALGVRSKRGAGRGCGIPSTVMKLSRATLCGCLIASDMERI